MRIYHVLMYDPDKAQQLQDLSAKQKEWYPRTPNLYIPEETDIIIRPATERILQHSEKINWDRETRLPAIHQRRVV